MVGSPTCIVILPSRLVFHTGMNRKEKQVQINFTLHPEVVFVLLFSLFLKHSCHVIHPIVCPFDYLFALKPKNPV